ncbi:Fur-regulated basic protein FbpA [Peribacillus loiseleuriae]|uniref:Fur-regulated basic protein FbpA n=1 Tax=Peribacillus loiseleuriae TaxID=1679170 RepID=UPI0009E2BD49|nr:Fur-regulated basic protein FbpA [Peribacillus loiseleuriae]
MMNQTNINETLNKEELIQELLKNGIYKKYDKQLYELPFVVLEQEFNHVRGES